MAEHTQLTLPEPERKNILGALQQNPHLTIVKIKEKGVRYPVYLVRAQTEFGRAVLGEHTDFFFAEVRLLLTYQGIDYLVVESDFEVAESGKEES